MMSIMLACNITTGGTLLDIFFFVNLIVLVGSVRCLLFVCAFLVGGGRCLLEFDESGE